jgi:hypothetical protein
MFFYFPQAEYECAISDLVNHESVATRLGWVRLDFGGMDKAPAICAYRSFIDQTTPQQFGDVSL